MQKVITIHGQSFVGVVDHPSMRAEETTYPQLQNILDEGYEVKQTIPVQHGAAFSVTFVLEKRKGSRVM